MKRTKEMKKEWIAELKKMQNPIRGKFPDDLPFDLTAELGEVVTVELKSRRILHCDQESGRYSRVSRGICCDG